MRTARGAHMMVANTVRDLGSPVPSVVSVGTFDGMHRGHQAILGEVVSRARASGARSIAITFDPHPQEVVGRKGVELLMTLDERLSALERLDLDATLVIGFTTEFSRLTPREFYVRYLIEGVGAAEVVEGHDHTFGRDREASVATLVELGREFRVTTTAVHPVVVGGERVGSTAIRAALREGKVDRAALFLGRPYSLAGEVVRGDGRGAQLGFPTANIRPASAKKLIPANGVYAVTAEWKNAVHRGMLNIGSRPTFHADGERTIEVHLFEFDTPIYGEQLRVDFLRRIRDEKRFASKDELIQQLATDRATCKGVFAG